MRGHGSQWFFMAKSIDPIKLNYMWKELKLKKPGSEYTVKKIWFVVFSYYLESKYKMSAYKRMTELTT